MSHVGKKTNNIKAVGASKPVGVSKVAGASKPAAALCFGKWGKIAVSVFIAGNIFNVGVGYHCWTSWCYPLYVWISLVPALSAGLHFAIGGMLKCPRGVCMWLCGFQAFFTSLYWYSFKNSDDILKLFAGTRYFELFAVAPHLVSYLNGRLALYFADPSACKSAWKHALGFECTPDTKQRQKLELQTFFPVADETYAGSFMEFRVFANQHVNHCLTALFLLVQMQVVLFLMMFAVYVLGPWTTASHMLCYGPISLVILVWVRDRYSNVIVLSALLGVAHGLTHLIYPFLDEVIGVVHEVDVWQDQAVHALQAVLFGYIWWGKMM